MLSWRKFLALLGVAGAFYVTGCGQRMQLTGLKNTPPEVVLATPGGAANTPSGFTHDLQWSGSDRDGRIDHYLVAVNPRSVDRIDASWSATPDRSRTIAVRRAAPMNARHEAGDTNEGPTIVAIRAVDDGGALSDPAVRAFFDGNVAPSVRITVPQPSALSIPLVPSTLRVRWEGVDLDGVFTQKPVKYKYRLIPEYDPLYAIGVTDPDSLRRLFAPRFADWDSTSGDTTEVRFTNLNSGSQYLFAITAFDEAGDYDPVFSLSKNLLRFRVGFAGTGGPRIALFNEFFNYTYPSGGFSTDPSRIVQLDVPASTRVTINWIASPGAGLEIAGYRWGLDLTELDDSVTPGTEMVEPDHGGHYWRRPRWSPWSLTTLSATVGPFYGPAADSAHMLYIEAADNVGNISLGIVRLRPVRIRYDSEVLIVDDTRFRTDRRRPDGTLEPPRGAWPTAAELDTFLFAQGGAPWQEYPPGTISSPGLFAGYDFDTLDTRTGRADLTVPYETLARYRHVVWIVDGAGAANFRSGTDPTSPMTALRYMSSQGRVNTLAQYVERGGHLWLMGGGGAASMLPWNNASNDRPTLVFSIGAGELVPGRFMYDLVHWRSEFRVASAPTRMRRVHANGSRHLGWFGSLLPDSILPRSPATDALPPLRSPQDFYTPYLYVEFLQHDNIIEEGRGSRGRGWCAPPPLDTLYAAVGGGSTSLPPPSEIPYNVVMTYYHGDENGTVLFTGFEPWGGSRSSAAQLVDAVLQGLWHQRKMLPSPVAAEDTEMRRATP